MESPRQLVWTHGPRLGKCWAHFEIGIRLDERVEDVLQNLELEICGGLLRVELVGFACDRRDQIAG
jgi:hypothetical protein